MVTGAVVVFEMCQRAISGWWIPITTGQRVLDNTRAFPMIGALAWLVQNVRS